jgi:DNA polymerase V
MSKHIHVFSSNFTLYRDLSQRVMSVIEDAWEEVEIYSVDEAFLNLSALPPDRHESFCIDLQKKIFKWTGIPTSIGLGASKTLTKISNHVAKKCLKVPVFNVMNELDWLKRIDIGDVWGIGRQWRKKLMCQGINTAYDLTQIDPNQLRRQYNVVMMRTAMELNGVSCLAMEQVEEPRKSILSSRSFNKMETELDVLAQAVSMHCASVYEKLRQQRSLARHLSVFLRTNRFREDLPQYEQSASVRFIVPTDDIRVLTHHAKQCLREIFKPAFQYKKVGVWLDDLSDNSIIQCDLFQKQDEAKEEETAAFLSIFDSINKRYGKNTVRLASVGFDKTWDTQFEFKSPAYTTRWTQLPVLKNLT